MEASAMPLEEPTLLDQAGEFAQTQVKLLKYKAVDTGAELASSFIAGLVKAVLIASCIMILNVGICLWVGEILGKSYYGFFVVGGVYALIAVLLGAFGGKLMKEPISNMIIKKILK